MKNKQLKKLQSLAEKARQDFKNDIDKKYTYQQLEKITGLSNQQLFRFINNQKGQPKFETIIGAYIKFQEFIGGNKNV